MNKLMRHHGSGGCGGRLWLMTIICVAFIAMLASAPTQAADFAFVIIADPHIDGNPAHEAKLQSIVTWINANQVSKQIALVFILGDIGWSGQLPIAKAILDGLQMPYVPIIGDNEIGGGSEVEFDEIFGPQFDKLAATLTNWKKAPTPVFNPQIGVESYLQNYSFDYKGCHFACADFASRYAGDESAELHDFNSGTWPWLKNDIASSPKTKLENIVILTHLGMFENPFAFDFNQMSRIKSLSKGYKANIDSNYSGHFHFNWTQNVPLVSPYYVVRMTGAAFDGVFRRVAVTVKPTSVGYSQEVLRIK